jgi:hypothetical protein
VGEQRDETRIQRLGAASQVPKRHAEIRAFDELEYEIMRAVCNAEIEHSRNVPVMKKRRQPRLSEEHPDELRIVRESREDAFEADLVLEAPLTAPDRDERFGHTPDAKPRYELVVSERLEGQSCHRTPKLPHP